MCHYRTSLVIQSQLGCLCVNLGHLRKDTIAGNLAGIRVVRGRFKHILLQGAVAMAGYTPTTGATEEIVTASVGAPTKDPRSIANAGNRIYCLDRQRW